VGIRPKLEFWRREKSRLSCREQNHNSSVVRPMTWSVSEFILLSLSGTGMVRLVFQEKDGRYNEIVL
jgi:hypothetical protein